MAREAKLIIAAENKATAEIKSAIRDLTGIDAAAKKVGDSLKAAFTITAIVAAGKQIADFAIDCTKAFGDVQRSMLQLNAALGGNAQSFQRMTSLIDEMARKTTAPKDAIEQLVAELASLGNSDADIDRITRATVALSNVTGKDLNSAFTMIQATFSGTSGKLEKLVPELGNLTEGQLKAGDAVDLLNAKFGKISDAMATGVNQQLSNLSKSWDDFREAFGQGLEPIFSPMLSGIQSIIDRWTGAINESNKYHDNLKKMAQGDELAALEVRLHDLQSKMTVAQQNYKMVYQQEINAGSTPAVAAEAAEGQRAVLGALSIQISSLENQIKSIKAEQAAASPRPTGLPGDTGPILGTDGSDVFGSPPFRNATWADRAAYLSSMTPEYDRPGYTGAQYGAAFAGDYGTNMPYGTEGTGFGADAPLFKALEPLGKMFESLTGGFGSLFTSLSSVSQILDPIGTILGSMFDVLGPLVDQMLAPIVGILKIVGEIMGKTLIPILNVLTPVIEALANIFIWFMNKIMVPVGNFVIDIWNGIAKVLNWALGWAGVNIAYADHVAAVTLSDATAAGSTATSSSGTGSNGAAYTGARNVTFNFYNQGNVVGSGGLSELAHLLANILATEERYA